MSSQAGGVLPSLAPLPFFRSLEPRSAAKLKLICFPGIGGTGAQFKKWPASFPESLEIWTFAWPEIMPGDYHAFLSDVAQEISPHLDSSFAIVGYSLGGIPAVGMANVLRSAYSGRTPLTGGRMDC